LRYGFLIRADEIQSGAGEGIGSGDDGKAVALSTPLADAVIADPAKWLECQTERAHIQGRPPSGQTIHSTLRTVRFRFDYWRRRCNTALRVES